MQVWINKDHYWLGFVICSKNLNLFRPLKRASNPVQCISITGSAIVYCLAYLYIEPKTMMWPYIVYRVKFAPCNFCPSTLANSFAQSLFRLDINMLLRDIVWDIVFRPVSAPAQKLLPAQKSFTSSNIWKYLPAFKPVVCINILRVIICSRFVNIGSGKK